MSVLGLAAHSPHVGDGASVVEMLYSHILQYFGSRKTPSFPPGAPSLLPEFIWGHLLACDVRKKVEGSAAAAAAAIASNGAHGRL